MKNERDREGEGGREGGMERRREGGNKDAVRKGKEGRKGG